VALGLALGLGVVLVEGTPSEIAADGRVREIYLGEGIAGDGGGERA